MTKPADMGLNIAHAAAPQDAASGDFVYRVRRPGAAMGAVPGVHCVSFTTVCRARDRLFREADVLVLQMLGDPDMLPVVLERRRRRRLTVFEVSDNFLEFQAANPAAAFYEDPASRAAILQLLSLCHAMQTTMPELETRFSIYNPRCGMFMNQMQGVGRAEREPGPVVVGWGGSSGHYEDVRRIAPVLIQWLERRPEVVLAVMADARIASLFDAVPRDRLRLTPPGSLKAYYDFVQSLHIGLAPLIGEEFNLCRSDVKFMEYAAHGVVPVCSNTPTYARTLRDGDTGFLFDTPEAMIEILDRLVDDEQLRTRVAAAARDYIRTERSAEDDARNRIDFYQTLINEMGLETGGDFSWLESDAAAERTPGTAHFFIPFDDVAQKLHDGLSAQFRGGDLSAALRLFKAAAEQAPDFYPARFYHANALLQVSLRRAAEEMEQAARVWPLACGAPLMLAQLRAEQGDTAAAIDIAVELANRVPEYASAHSALGDIRHAGGRGDLALTHYRAALDANPYYAPAAIKAGALLLNAGRHEEARGMFEAAQKIVPRHAPAYLGLGAACRMCGDQSAAEEHMLHALQLNPALEEAAAFLLDAAKQHYKAGHVEDAAALLESMVNARPEDYDAMFWLARTRERAGRAEAAQQLWSKLADSSRAGNYQKIARDKLNKKPGI